MKLARSYVDGFLVQWEEGEYKAELKSMRQRSEALTARVKVSGRRDNGNVAARAQAVRDRLDRQIRKVPEVMVKIYSSCKGMRQVGRHLEYISRDGQIEMEDQDGLILKGREQLQDLKEGWRVGGLEEIPPTSDRRDTLNITLSMPARTDEVSMKRAVRAFAVAEFDGYEYVFAYHTQATDPDPNPPEHPHVHLSVKTLSRSGKRLNPRKADLKRWREDFAAQLRAHGIEANATTRLARLQPDRGEKRAVLGIKARGGLPQSTGLWASPTQVAGAKALEAQRRAYYALAVDVLSKSEDASDGRLGRKLAASLAEKTPEGPSKPAIQASLDPER